MIRIGRLTFNRATHRPRQWDGKRDQLQIAGRSIASTANTDEVHRLRQQLRAMVGQIVPVTWDAYDWEDGFYRVTNAEVGSQAGITAEWSIDLERLGAVGDVDFEAWLITAELYNEHGLTGTFWHAPPADADAYHTSAGARMHERDGDGVTVPVWVGVEQEAVFAVDPDGWYAGAVELTAAGRTVAGLEDAGDVPDGWQLANGLVRVLPNAGGLTVGTWTVPDGGYTDLYSDTYGAGGAPGWADIGWSFTIDGAPVTGWDRFAVLHNRPDFTAVRLVRATAGRRVTCDVSLRRGSRTAVVVLRADETHDWTVERTTVEAAEEFLAGIIAAAPDTAGNRYVAATTRAFTADLANGGLARTARGVDVALGVQVGDAVGSGGSDDLAVSLSHQYFGYANEQTTPVRR